MRHLFILFWLSSISLFAQSPLVSSDSLAQKQWVDSLYINMSLKERVGQLFMVQAFSEEKKSSKNKTFGTYKKTTYWGHYIFKRRSSTSGQIGQ